jgi:hypothetical protein
MSNDIDIEKDKGCRTNIAKVNTDTHDIIARYEFSDLEDHIVVKLLNKAGGGDKHFLHINGNIHMVWNPAQVKRACQEEGVSPASARQLLNQIHYSGHSDVFQQ